MDAAGTAWFEELQAYAAARRVEVPLPSLKEASPPDRLKLDILFGEIRDWFGQGMSWFRTNRQLAAAMHDLAPDPYVVFTSDLLGVACITGVFPRGAPEWLAALTDAELEEFQQDNPDTGFRWHMHYWSRIETVTDPAELAAFQKQYPIGDGSEYWIHRIGTDFAPLGGRGMSHLWAWDGSKEELLCEGAEEWVR